METALAVPLIAQALVDQADDLEQDIRWRAAADDAETSLQRGRILKRELMRRYAATVSKGVYPTDSYQQMAKWLDDLTGFALYLSTQSDVVSKAALTEEFEQWADRRVKRIGGRFARSTATGTPKQAKMSNFGKPGSQARFAGPSTHNARQLGLDYDVSSGRLKPMAGQQLDEQRVNQHLAAIQEAQMLERELKRAFGSDAKHVKLELNVRHPQQHRAERREVELDELQQKLSDFDPSSGVIEGMDARLDLEGLDTGTKNRLRQKSLQAQAGFAVPKPLRTRSGGEAPQIGSLSPKTAGSTRENLARSTTALGQLMSGLGATGPGSAAQLVGQALDSDAAAALAPYAERAAMRYTGHRVKPSRETVKILGTGGAGAALDQLTSADERSFTAGLAKVPDQLEALANAPEAGQAREGMAALAASLRSRQQTPQGAYAEPPSRDQIMLGARSDLGALAMSRKLPDDPLTVALSLESGQTLPSRGVILDAKGNVQYEAVGSADDHYTPFSGNMLGKLGGGQYVRTRNAGGPTMEDIRTLLTSGARMATVVSPSGVYEIELDPNARGSRRFAPAAQQAINSYATIVDQVQSSGMFLGELPPEAVKRIEVDAVSMYPEPSQADKRQEHVKTETKKLKNIMAAEAIGATMDSFKTQATDEVKQALADASANGQDTSDADVDELVRMRTEQLYRARVRPLVLNGEGYDAALRTWAARHPNLVRSVNYRPLNSFYGDLGLSRSAEGVRSAPNAEDSGYVPRGQIRTNRPRSAPTPPPAESRTAGGAAPGTPESTSSGAASPEPEPQAGPPVPDSTPVGQALQPVADRVAMEAGEALRQLDVNALRFGDGATWDWAVKNDPSSPTMVAAGMLQSSNGEDLFERLSTDTKMRAALLAPQADIEREIRSKKSYYLPEGTGENSAERLAVEQDASAKAKPLASALQGIAVASLLANPGYTRMPTRTSGSDNPTLPVLTDAMTRIGSTEDYEQWRSSGSEDAKMAAAGRALLSTPELTSATGSEFVSALLDRTRDTWANARRIASSAARVRPGDTPDSRGRLVEQAFPTLDPDLKAGLRSDRTDERIRASERLLNAVRLGFSSALLASQLEAEEIMEAGGADPKGWYSPIQGQNVLKRAERGISSTLLYRRVSSPRLTA